VTGSAVVGVPQVSVIIIFLDEECFLAESVDSVLRQTFTDWELLLVDDGSTDTSPDIALRLVQRDPTRLRYLRHPGGATLGMSATRNLGLAHARAPLIAFLDADDVWLASKLAEQVTVLAEYPEAALVYGRTLLWHSWSGPSSPADFFYDLGVVPDHLYQPPRLFEVLLENTAQTPTTSNALMRRTLIDEVGGFEPSFRGMFEDQVFFAKALWQAAAWVDSRVWAHYRQHADSHSALSSAAGDDDPARLRFLRWLRAYLRQQGGLDARTRRAIAREIGRARLRRARLALRRLVGRVP
jgi:glycosyltransferase involved in cell wall biosynthesis